MQLFGDKINYYFGIGYMYRIPRYDNKKHHISSEIRESWVKEDVSKHKHFSVFSICGELSSVEFIELIVNNPKYDELCDSYEVIFGPKIESNEIKDKLKNLLRKGSKLKVYSYPERPKDHGIKLEDRLFCEEEHPMGTKYKFATIIERVSNKLQEKFMSDFNSLKERATIVNLNNIDTVETMC
jgi:hypothetical protein